METFARAVLLGSVTLALGACAPGKTTIDSTAPSSAQETDPPVDEPVEPLPPVDPGGPSAPAPQPFPETAEKFNMPWKNKNTAIVIDAYQGNAIDWTKMASDRRVVGVIHRATIGMRVDTKYHERKRIARGAGYLWGAYHLGLPGNPEEQAEFFLRTVGDDPATMMILDLESAGSSSFMSIPEAIEFMEHVHAETGRIPVVYANHSTTKALNAAAASNPLFKASKLWYARFRGDIPDFPRGVWPTYFLWQFSSEINCSKTGSCLYNVPGTAYDMDVNVFYGTKEALAAAWK